MCRTRLVTGHIPACFHRNTNGVRRTNIQFLDPLVQILIKKKFIRLIFRVNMPVSIHMHQAQKLYLKELVLPASAFMAQGWFRVKADVFENCYMLFQPGRYYSMLYPVQAGSAGGYR